MANRKNTVLVVDDEPLIRLALVIAFEDHGFEVTEAGNVLEAVAILSRGHIDALVTDVDMPGGLSGLDLVDLVAAISSAALVIVSGRLLPSDYTLPAEAMYIAKPYDIERVIASTRAQIAHRAGSFRAAASIP